MGLSAGFGSASDVAFARSLSGGRMAGGLGTNPGFFAFGRPDAVWVLGCGRIRTLEAWRADIRSYSCMLDPKKNY